MRISWVGRLGVAALLLAAAADAIGKEVRTEVQYRGQSYPVRIEGSNAGVFEDNTGLLKLIQASVQGGTTTIDLADVNLTVFRSDGSEPLPYCEAMPILADTVVHQNGMTEVFPSNEWEVVDLPQGHFLNPKVFSAFLSESWIKNKSNRKAAYRRAFKTLFSQLQLQALLEEQKKSESVIAGTGARWAVRSEQLGWGVSELGDIASNLADVERASKFFSPKKLSKLKGTAGRASAPLKIVGAALDTASAGLEAGQRSALMQLGFALAANQAQAQSVIQGLESYEGLDPAMVEGAKEAYRDLEGMAEEKLLAVKEGFKEATAQAARHGASESLSLATNIAVKHSSHVTKVLGKTGASTAGSLVGGTVSGLISVGFDTWDASKQARHIAALVNIGVAEYQIVNKEKSQSDPYNVDLDREEREEVVLRHFYRFNHYAAFLIYHHLVEALYEERSLSKAVYYFKDLINPGLRDYLTDEKDRLRHLVLEDAAVDRHFSWILEELQSAYGGPRCRQAENSDGIDGQDPQKIIAVVDSSGSMKRTDPKDLRLKALRMMLDLFGPNVHMGLIDFDDDAEVLGEPTALGAVDSTARQRFRRRLQSIDADGGTALRSGLKAAAGLSEQEKANATWIVLSDGKDDSWQGAAQPVPKGVTVNTIALSDRADRQALARLAAATGGIAEVAQSAGDLQRIIPALLGAAEGREVLLSREGTLQPEQTRGYRFFIEPGVQQGVVQVTWPGSDVDLQVTDPEGKSVDTGQAVSQGQGVESDTYDIIRLQDPAPGEWQVQVVAKDVAKAGEPFTLRATTAKSEIKTEWRLNRPVPEVDKPLAVEVDTQGDVAWRSARVSVQPPNGNPRTKEIELDVLSTQIGGGSGQGIYRMVPDQSGVYRFQVTLKGATPDGRSVRRELDRTFRVAERGKGIAGKEELPSFIRH